GIRVELVTGVQTCALPIFPLEQNRFAWPRFVATRRRMRYAHLSHSAPSPNEGEPPWRRCEAGWIVGRPCAAPWDWPRTKPREGKIGRASWRERGEEKVTEG